MLDEACRKNGAETTCELAKIIVDWMKETAYLISAKMHFGYIYGIF